MLTKLLGVLSAALAQEGFNDLAGITDLPEELNEGHNCVEDQDYSNFFRGHALASQRNTTDLNGECYVKTDMVLGQYGSWFNSISNAAIYVIPSLLDEDQDFDALNLSYLDLFVPIQYGGSLSISLSDAMVACDVDQVLQQAAFRLTTAAGRQDLEFVFVSGAFGWMKQWNSWYNNPLYNAVEPLVKAFWNKDNPEM